MKKLLTLLSILCVCCLVSSSALACVYTQPTGSAGNQNAPATGYITGISANGTNNLTVTYTSNGGGSVQSIVSFYYGSGPAVWLTGSWSGTKITSFSIAGVFADPPETGVIAGWYINGVKTILTHGFAQSTGQLFAGGTDKGMTGIAGLGLGQRKVAFYGVQDGVQRTFAPSTLPSSGCTWTSTSLDVMSWLNPPSVANREWWQAFS